MNLGSYLGGLGTTGASPADESRLISRRIRYDRSEPELQRFLNRLVEDGKLESAAGQYKIKRS